MTRSRSLALYARTRRRRASPEASLQCCVVEHMRLMAMPGCFVLSIPNEHVCSEARGAMLNKMGRMAGAADLLVVRPSYPPLFLELKAKGGKQSPAQLAFEDLCAHSGCAYAIADNIDAALTILRDARALQPATGLRSRAA